MTKEDRIEKLIREIVQRQDVESRVNGINTLLTALISDATAAGYREGHNDALEGGLL